MADPVNSPLLTVAPVEPAASKSAKIGNAGAKSGESDNFSRVLDDQRARDASTQGTSDTSSATNNSTNGANNAGKPLPPQGNEAADPASKGTAAAADKAALANADGTPESDTVGARAPLITLPDGELTTASPGVSQFSASLDDSLALGSRAFPAVAVDAGVQSDSTPDAETLGTAAKPAEALPLGALAKPQSTAFANAPANPVIPAAATTSDASTGTERLPGLGADATAKASVAAGALPGTASAAAAVVPSTTGSTPRSATASSAASPLIPANGAVDANLATTTRAASASFQDGEAPALSPLTGDARAKSLDSGPTERGISLAPDSQTSNRSTSDWLRSGMGSQAAGQQGLADTQADSSAELTRGLMSSQRVDGSAPAPTASTVASLTPASTVASSALPTASATPSAMPEYSLSRAPDDAEFSGELTARMKTLVRDGVREARLQLHPAELGRLQVTVTTEGDQTKVAFTAETAAARDAIEQSMPRLREMLEQSGLQLAQSDVGQRDLQGKDERGSDGQFAEQQGASEGTDVDSPVLVTSTSGNGRIDTYI